MTRLTSICFAVLVCCFMGCSKIREKTEPRSSRVDIQFQSLDIDTLNLDIEIFSAEGFLRLQNDTIVYLDKVLKTAFLFNQSGMLIDRKLGEGTGPDQIPGFSYHACFEGHHFFVGATHDLTDYNGQWIRDYPMVRLEFDQSKAPYASEDFDQVGTYGFNYRSTVYDTKWLALTSKRELIIPIDISPRVNPEFNSYTPGEYFRNSYAMAVINSTSGEVKKLFGHKPPIYQGAENYSTFDYLVYDIQNDSILVTYPIDSLIYVYTPDFELAYSFGLGGKEMRTSYPSVIGLEKYQESWRDSYTNYGVYYHIYCDEKAGLVFRSYNKGKSSYGGMQIYHGTKLVFDGEVPKRFNVIGDYNGYYYADGIIDEENETLKIFKFKL